MFEVNNGVAKIDGSSISIVKEYFIMLSSAVVK